MFYAFSYTPVITDTEAAPHVLDMKMSAGVIHQVDVLFQSGCSHQIFVKILDRGHQVWPTNRGEKMRGDATVISFREFKELKVPGNILQAHIWTTLTTDFKEVIIQVGILDRAILEPLSFQELVSALKGAGGE